MQLWKWSFHMCIWREWGCLVCEVTLICVYCLFKSSFLILSGSRRGFKKKIAVLITSRPPRFLPSSLFSLSHKLTLSDASSTIWISLKAEQATCQNAASDTLTSAEQQRTRRGVERRRQDNNLLIYPFIFAGITWVLVWDFAGLSGFSFSNWWSGKETLYKANNGQRWDRTLQYSDTRYHRMCWLVSAAERRQRRKTSWTKLNLFNSTFWIHLFKQIA